MIVSYLDPYREVGMVVLLLWVPYRNHSTMYPKTLF